MYFTQHVYFTIITAYLQHNLATTFPLFTISLKMANVGRNM